VVDENASRFLERLYTEMSGKLFTYAYAVIEDEYRAQDLVHETFLIAVKKIDSVKLSPNPKGWLMNTLKNVIKHEIRDWNEVAEVTLSFAVLDETATVVSQTYDEVELDYIRASLSADEWWLLSAAYLEGRKYAEIAHELGIEYDACRKRVRKVRDKVIMLWEKENL
jgi:RNA polymerase sigma-70 factor (ECF subfamily)